MVAVTSDPSAAALGHISTPRTSHQHPTHQQDPIRQSTPIISYLRKLSQIFPQQHHNFPDNPLFNQKALNIVYNVTNQAFAGSN